MKRKIAEQGGRCGICHEEFSCYNDVVPDHKNPKGKWVAGGETIPRTISRQYIWWCNEEKGSTRMEG
jgi:hypothetical protein